MKNIVIEKGGIVLTLVNGGPVATQIKAEGPTPERSAHVVRLAAAYDVLGWEALAFVARLEAFAGREIDDDELEAFLTHVSTTRMHQDYLAKMLAGAAMVVPRDHMGRVWIVDPLDEDYKPEWTEAVRGGFEENRVGRVGAA